jgi:hypothetical protein
MEAFERSVVNTSFQTLFFITTNKGGDHQEDLGVDERTTFRWILGK